MSHPELAMVIARLARVEDRTSALLCKQAPLEWFERSDRRIEQFESQLRLGRWCLLALLLSNALYWVASL